MFKLGLIFKRLKRFTETFFVYGSQTCCIPSGLLSMYSMYIGLYDTAFITPDILMYQLNAHCQS